MTYDVFAIAAGLWAMPRWPCPYSEQAQTGLHFSARAQ